jgi:cytolysin (calcineurin-like family phosphatase)
MEDVGIFFAHLVYFTATYTYTYYGHLVFSWSFGIYFPPLHHEISGNPDSHRTLGLPWFKVHLITSGVHPGEGLLVGSEEEGDDRVEHDGQNDLGPIL